MNARPSQPASRTTYSAEPVASVRGFTLVEVLTVVIILGIAAALAVPMMGNTALTKLQGASSALVADLAYAQIESLAHSEDKRVVVFDNPNDTYHIALTSDTATPITNPINKEPYLVDYGTGPAESLSGVTITGYDLDGDDMLGFGIYGGLDQATDATITLACEGFSVTITVDPNTGESTIGSIN